MLQHMDPKEQSISAECLWSLSFDRNVRQKVLVFPDLMDALENLKDSENYIVRRNVGGALWLIKGKNDQTTTVTCKCPMQKIQYAVTFSTSNS